MPSVSECFFIDFKGHPVVLIYRQTDRLTVTVVISHSVIGITNKYHTCPAMHCHARSQIRQREWNWNWEKRSTWRYFLFYLFRKTSPHSTHSLDRPVLQGGSMAWQNRRKARSKRRDNFHEIHLRYVSILPWWLIYEWLVVGCPVWLDCYVIIAIRPHAGAVSSKVCCRQVPGKQNNKSRSAAAGVGGWKKKEKCDETNGWMAIRVCW